LSTLLLPEVEALEALFAEVAVAQVDIGHQ
jgi:hypothetical protein